MILKAILILTIALALTEPGYVEYKDEIENEDVNENAQTEENQDLNIKKEISPSRVHNYTFPRNCAQAAPQVSAPYLIKIPNSGLNQFFAYCEVDPDGGSAWTRIQQNTDGTHIIYTRSWITYKHGFGDIGSNHFIGLEKIHALTLSEPHELWIQVEDTTKTKHNFKYSLFAIGDENQVYTLNVLGTYRGVLRDSLRKHVGMQFCTYDRDCSKCAQRHNGGWWFHGCFPTLLNGDRKPNRTGIIWYHEFGKLFVYKFSKMLIRPVSSKVHSK